MVIIYLTNLHQLIARKHLGIIQLSRQYVPGLSRCIPIPACMITRSVTIEDIDDLYLMWNDHINASALYRRALREEMEVRGVDPDELRDLLERAREQGYTLDEIAEDTNRFDDLQSLVEEQQNQPTAGDATDD